MTGTLRRCITLGGIRQKIVIEERREHTPVMVMFHGGPWSPVVYGLSYVGFYPELSRRFTLVWWDQYGCGKNYDPHVPRDITVENFADMAVDLVDALHRRFPDRPIILNGFSFGTYLTMQVARRRPRIVSAVINVSPIMNMREATVNFRHAIEERISARERVQLERLRTAVRYDPYLSRIETLVGRYTRGMSYRVPLLNDMLLRLLTSHEYTLRDVWGAAMGSIPPGRSRRFATLWDSMGGIDLWPVAYSTTVPVLYIQGTSERYVLPGQLRQLAERRHTTIRYVGIERCGHMPTRRAWHRIEQAMIDFAVEHSSFGSVTGGRQPV